MDEVIKKLESVNTQDSSRAVSLLQKRLSSSRDPHLLGELVDHFITSGSKHVLKVLSSLKDVQSQDFFSKLHECMHSKTPMRIPVLRLLAHCLNKQTSWLYKIVQHPLFMSLLHYLKISQDVLVLTSGLLVLAAILPLVPSHLSSHLPDVFQIFADLATVRTSNRLKLAPKPLYLHLDVAIYYLFLQLYALFPCNFFTFLRGRYGPTGERRYFQQYIAPLFNFVKFHPGLVMDSNSSETHGDKWRSMEPDEIATLSLTLCLDLAITVPSEEGVDTGSAIPIPPALHPAHSWEPASCMESSPQDDSHLNNPPDPLSQIYPRPPSILDPFTGMYSFHTTPSLHSSSHASEGTPSPVKGLSPRNTRRSYHRAVNGSSSLDSSIRDGPTTDRDTSITEGAAPFPDASNLVGFKSTNDVLWSPTLMFDSTISHHSPCQPGPPFTNTVVAAPSPEVSSTPSLPSTSQHTPRPMTTPTFTYRNYSPTASVGGESLSRQPSNQTTAVGNTGIKTQSQEPLEGAPVISSNRLTRSLYASPTSVEGGRQLDSQQRVPPQSVPIKRRFEKFFSIFSSKKSPGADYIDNEEFTEIFAPDTIQGGHRPTGQPGIKGVRGVSGAGVTREGDCEVGREEMGVEATEEPNSSSGSTSSDYSESGVQSEDRGESQVQEDNDSTTAVPPSTVPQSSISESRRSHLPASFPGSTQTPLDISRHVQRRRASQSESVAHTVLQVQEKLKQLAESQTVDETSDESQKDSEDREGHGCSTPPHTAVPNEECDRSENQVPDPINTVDSTNTLIGSVSSSNFPHHVATMARSLDANEAGETSLSGSLHRERKFSGILMRRVSVCDRKGVNSGTQTSAGDLGGNLVDFLPSPVVLLDQLVKHGEIMHEGDAQDIPLTELEGIDWFRFGGCPHNEELGQMQSQVALLHSQLLFERYQCLQHARRNRRLLSKARSAHRVREELEYLRHHYWHQKHTLDEAQRLQVRQGVGAENRLRAENRALSEENRSLKEDSNRLTVELYRLQEENSRLNREMKESREKVFALESKCAHMQPQVALTSSLQEKVVALERELLVLGRLYHNQREEALSLLAHGRGKQEWTQLISALKNEKEVAEKERAGLLQEIEGLKTVVATLRENGLRVREEKAVLEHRLQHVQGQCQEKIKASQEKYEALLAVSHQLESHLTELRAHSLMKRRVSPHQHKRSSSHPPVPRHLPSPARTKQPTTHSAHHQ